MDYVTARKRFRRCKVRRYRTSWGAVTLGPSILGLSDGYSNTRPTEGFYDKGSYLYHTHGSLSLIGCQLRHSCDFVLCVCDIPSKPFLYPSRLCSCGGSRPRITPFMRIPPPPSLAPQNKSVLGKYHFLHTLLLRLGYVFYID